MPVNGASSTSRDDNLFSLNGTSNAQLSEQRRPQDLTRRHEILSASGQHERLHPMRSPVFDPAYPTREPPPSSYARTEPRRRSVSPSMRGRPTGAHSVSALSSSHESELSRAGHRLSDESNRYGRAAEHAFKRHSFNNFERPSASGNPERGPKRPLSPAA